MVPAAVIGDDGEDSWETYYQLLLGWIYFIDSIV
jgi:hypothetical protein